MSYCFNPECLQPQNAEDANFCTHCGQSLILRGRYRIVRAGGRTEYTRQFIGRDRDRLGAPCTIRACKLPTPNESLMRREAARLYELGEHPQIPSLLAYFAEGDSHYFVQEYARGQNLRHELEAGVTFTEAEIWLVLRDLVPVLEFVHDRRTTHRQIEPVNIVRRDIDGKFGLVNFALTRAIAGSTGRNGYMAPELHAGQPAIPSSDLFSLGVTCFRLLSNLPMGSLFAEYGFGWLTRWQQALKPPPSDALLRILDRLLQEDPAQRYGSATELLADMENLHGVTVERGSESDLGQEESDFIDAFLEDLRAARAPITAGRPAVSVATPQAAPPPSAPSPTLPLTAETLQTRYEAGERDFEDAKLPGIVLHAAHLVTIDLSGADLGGGDLSNANLANAKLIGANLSGTNLAGTNLLGANLSGANLTEANLRAANLTGARLMGATLAKANLNRADLTCADAYCANFQGATLAKTRLIRANLTEANFLDATLEEVRWEGATLRDTRLPDGRVTSKPPEADAASAP